MFLEARQIYHQGTRTSICLCELGIVKCCVTTVPDVSCHNNQFPSCTFPSMLRACPPTPLQLAPPEACFYLRGQPSNDSALTNYRTCTRSSTHIYRHTLPLAVFLWGLCRLCSQGFSFLFILPVSFSDMRISRCVRIHASFIFTSSEGPRKTKRRTQLGISSRLLLSRTCNLKLTLGYCIIFKKKQRSTGDSKKEQVQTADNRKHFCKTSIDTPAFSPFFLSFFLTFHSSTTQTFFFEKHPRHHPDCFLCVFHVLYWNLGWVFCTMDTTCGPNKLLISTKIDEPHPLQVFRQEEQSSQLKQMLKVAWLQLHFCCLTGRTNTGIYYTDVFCLYWTKINKSFSET